MRPIAFSLLLPVAGLALLTGCAPAPARPTPAAAAAARAGVRDADPLEAGRRNVRSPEGPVAPVLSPD